MDVAGGVNVRQNGSALRAPAQCAANAFYDRFRRVHDFDAVKQLFKGLFGGRIVGAGQNQARAFFVLQRFQPRREHTFNPGARGVTLLDQGVLAFRKVGNQRRVRVRDVIVYQQQQYERATQAMQEVTRLSDEMGLYD